MKKFSIVLIGSLLLSFPVFASTNYVPRITNAESSIYKYDFKEGMRFFNQAYYNYYLAKNSTDNLVAADNYAQAIANISKANVIEQDNVSYIALAMQIYRGKGVLPYAKSSILKAEKILEDKCQREPNNVEVLLDYAILCYAGDMAYRPEKDQYKTKACFLANKVITKTEGLKDAKALRNRALAYLLLNKKENFIKLLSKKADDSRYSNEKATNNFYLNLYKKTVGNKQWIWPVAEKYLDNEYLLYYLCDISR